MKRLNAFLSLLLSVIMIATSFPLGVISAERVASDSVTGPTARAGSINNDLLQSSKTVSYNGDGTYTLKMEGYATASAIPKHTDSVVPVDVAIIIDHSGSQDRCIQCETSLSGWTKYPYRTNKGKYDTSKVYYNASPSKPIYYCNDCAKWYGSLHYFGFHGGTEYILAGNKDADQSIVQFYTYQRNACCGSSCSHDNYKHPIYAEYVEKNENTVYYRTPGNSKDVRYCSDCEGWYNIDGDNDEDHAYVSTGTVNHDETDLFYPMKSGTDTREVVHMCLKTDACSQGGTCEARYVSAQRAIIEYLELLYSSAMGPDGKFGTSDDLNHRVALVDFYGGGDGGGNANSRYLTVKNTSTGDFVKHREMDDDTTSEITVRQTYASQAFKTLSSEADRTAIGEGLAVTDYYNGVYPHRAMKMIGYAYDYDAYESQCDNGQRKRIVIYTADYSDGSDLPDTVKAAKTLKDLNNTYVFSLALMSKYSYDTNPGGNVSVNNANATFHAVSSNFPYATSYTSSARGTVNSNLPSCGSYYHVATTEAAFKSEFAEIFNESVNGLTSFSMADSYMQDVVSSNFTVKSAKAYSMKYAGGTSWTTTGGTTYSPSISGNTVTVSGFDYTANWVGTTVKGKAQGQKLVLEIVIAPNNTSGNKLATNTQTSSGIYHTSNGMQEMFDLPYADVPTTVTVKNICQTSNATLAATVLNSYSGTGSGNYLQMSTKSYSGTANAAKGSSTTVSYVQLGSTFKVTGDNLSVVAKDASGQALTVTTSGNTHSVTVVHNMTVEITKHSYSSTVTAPTCTAQGYTTHKCSCGASYVDTYVNATGHTEATREENRIEATCTENGSYDIVTYCTVCKAVLKTESATITATGHKFVNKNGLDPTCTVPGYSAYEECSACHVTRGKEEIPAPGHLYDDGVLKKEPTCVDNGYITYICEVCGHTYNDPIPATGEHDHVLTETIEPTCVAKGKFIYTCTVCGNKLEESIPATGEHEYTYTVIDPTCVANGKTVYKCIVCAHSYEDIIPATGEHRRDVILGYIEPDCVTDGYIKYTCNVCGKTYEEVVPSFGEHQYLLDSEMKPTCTKKGGKLYICTVCGDMYEEKIPALGHTYGDYVYNNDATCTDDGTKTAKCIRCTKTDTVTATGTKLGHDKVNHEAKAPTCTEIGWDAYVTCTRCDYTTYVETPATDHNYDAVVTDPTCTTDGYTTYTCHNIDANTGIECGDTYVDNYVNALEHDWDEGVIDPDSTCTEEGVKTFTCTVCKETKTEAVSAKGHTPAEAVREQANSEKPTCTEDGIYHMVVYCSVCKAEIERKEHTDPKLGHDEVNHEAKAPTCTENGWDAYVTCSRCDYTTYVEIPAPGHKYDAVVTAPTCTEKGYTTYTCHCGDTYVDNYVDVLGHKNADVAVENIVEASCTKAGSYDNVVYCRVCGTELSRTTVEIAILDHTPGQAIVENIVDSTCSVAGSYDRVVNCSVCGKELSREKIDLPLASHTAGAVVIENNVAPTCTENGSYDNVINCKVCGHEMTRTTVVVPALGHTAGQVQVENVVAPTCTAEGSYDNVVYCTVCKDEISRNTVTVDATGHIANSAVAEKVKAPTCSEAGSYDNVVYCRTCKAELTRETIPVEKLPHKEETVAGKAASCTEDGLTDGKKCSVCGEILAEQSVISAKGHEETVASAVAPTCTKEGLTEGIVCYVCGEVLKAQQTLPALGHNYDAVVTVPTCTDKGYTTYTCNCGDTYVDNYVDVLGHTEVIDEATEPTCTETGLTEGKHCSVCNEVLVPQYPIPAGHKAGNTVVENVVAASCTMEGSYDNVVYCNVCNEQLSRVTVTLEKTGHTYGETVVENVVASTCTANGSYDNVVYCSVCSEQLSRVTVTLEKTGHTYGATVVENIVAPTCTTEGSYDNVVYCSVCNEQLSRVTVTLEKTAHLPGSVVVENYKAASCTKAGSYDEAVYCTACNTELSRNTVELAVTEHKYSTAVTEPDCINGGYTTYTCTVCGDTYVDNYVDALGHTEKILGAVVPTCTETGLTEGKQCTVCGVITVEQTIVPATGHTAGAVVVENYKAADCENAGSYDSVVYCTVCDAELTREAVEIDALGHSYDAVVTSPTCTEKGYTTYTCSECNDTYTDNYVDATNHVGEETYVLIVMENGNCYEITYCCRCDAELGRKLIDPVAQNVETSKYYTTLEAALAEVTAGDTVKLLDNVTVDDLNAPIAGYIDLNGHVLEAYTLSVGTSTHIVDSSAGNEGYLVVGSADQTINSSNCDMPVYVSYTDEDGTVKDGYRFFDSVKLQQLTPEFTEDVKTGSKFVSVTFRHIIGDAATSKELFGDGALDNGIKLGVIVKVTKADGETSEELYWICSDELIASAYSNGNAIKVTITGIEAYDTITIGSVLISEDLGVEMTTYEKNGVTYSTIGTYDISTEKSINA